MAVVQESNMSRLVKTIRGALVLAALGAGLAGGPALAQDPQVVQGRDIVQRNCGMCHAIGRADASPNAAAPAFRELNKRYPLDNLAEALGEGIITGHPQMPEFAFPPEQVSAIISYLKSIQTQQGADRTPSKGPQPGA
jgi:mono/diheme cytochrome c family protein